jgi:phage baseplate assembly protein W
MTQVAAVPGSAPSGVSAVGVADRWIGTGLRFPIRPDGVTGALPRVTGLDRIRQSIEQVLDTEPGERVMLPEFGCGLRRFLMEPNTLTTRSAIKRDIEQALARWEPRVRVTGVAVTPGEEPSLAWVQISYQLLSDRREDNLVYPFYFGG